MNQYTRLISNACLILNNNTFFLQCKLHSKRTVFKHSVGIQPPTERGCIRKLFPKTKLIVLKDNLMLRSQSDNQHVFNRCTRTSIPDIILPKFYFDVNSLYVIMVHEH